MESVNDTKILEPKLYYNAETGEWIVTCGGYYTYLDLSLQLQYVGARWYCANSYAPGFEDWGGENTCLGKIKEMSDKK